MMRKKVSYTNITPIPSFIPRALAIDILHSHGEIIELNPLVTGFEPIKAPRDAPADEFYSTWYEITERIQYIPGIGKLGSGNIKFKGCFHDMPWGLQTHIYAPASVDLRNKWRICGNQPDEPPEQRELGIGAPPEGLYLREDIEIKCNMTMANFVKKEMTKSSKVLVARLIKKAELLDAGVLHAMMEDGKLKITNPADRSMAPSSPRPSPNQPSPKQPYNMPMSPTRSSAFPHNQMSPQMNNQKMNGQMNGQAYIPPNHSQGQNNVVMELPGDYYHTQPPQNHLQPNDNRYSHMSDASGHQSLNRSSTMSDNYQGSIDSRPTSYSSEGMRSPGMDQKGFAAELPTMAETKEEPEQPQQPGDQKYRYNPQDFANTRHQVPAPLFSQQQQSYGGGYR